jgi:hypothetical protein
MRWLVAALGVIGLAGAVYFGLEPRLRRPVLRIAINQRFLNADDQALAEGIALALDERDFRAGRYRVATAHQVYGPGGGNLEIPTPRAHTMLYAMESLPALRAEGDERTLVSVNKQRETEAIRAWMRDRGLSRVEAVGLVRLLRTAETSEDLQDPFAAWLQANRPDVLYYRGNRFPSDLHQRLRAAGYKGAVFISSGSVAEAAVPPAETCYVVLAPLKSAPPDFLRRHPHPFAYVGYRGTLRYLDALDADIQADPIQLARNLPRSSAFDDLQEEPRVYEIKAGLFVPVPPK